MQAKRLAVKFGLTPEIKTYPKGLYSSLSESSSYIEISH